MHNEEEHISNKRNDNRIFVAFPGMGKTTYALSHPGVIDLDFGNYRSSLKVDKKQEGTLLTPFARLMKYYYKDGYDVLTNDPKLINLAKQFAEGRVVVVLPKDFQEHVERVKQREEKRHVNAEFPKLLAENVDKWVHDWESIAARFKVPVRRVKYFEEVMK